jgi:hypothetical protein
MHHLSASTRGRARAALLLALFATGCAGAARQTTDEPGDGADDSFLTGANVKADVAGIEDGSPAACAVTALKSGKTFHGGALREDLLDLSFGG